MGPYHHVPVGRFDDAAIRLSALRPFVIIPKFGDVLAYAVDLIL